MSVYLYATKFVSAASTYVIGFWWNITKTLYILTIFSLTDFEGVMGFKDFDLLYAFFKCNSYIHHRILIKTLQKCTLIVLLYIFSGFSASMSFAGFMGLYRFWFISFLLHSSADLIKYCMYKFSISSENVHIVSKRIYVCFCLLSDSRLV